MERKIYRDRKHPQSSDKRAIKKGPIQAAPSKAKPPPPPPSQAHLHSAEEACHFKWNSLPDGSLGKDMVENKSASGSQAWTKT